MGQGDEWEVQGVLAGGEEMSLKSCPCLICKKSEGVKNGEFFDCNCKKYDEWF
jgi:hypothetical protein